MTITIPDQAAFPNIPANGTGVSLTVFTFGFHCKSAANEWNLYVDDFALAFSQGSQCGDVPCGQQPSNYDWNFLDDYDRAKLCVNSTTGAFVVRVLSGPKAGWSYQGTCKVTISGTGCVQLSSPAGSPYMMAGTYLPLQKRAVVAFTCAAQGVSSGVADSNTTNNPPGC